MVDQRRRIGGGSERADWANKDTAGRKKEIFWKTEMQRGGLSRRRGMKGEALKGRKEGLEERRDVEIGGGALAAGLQGPGCLRQGRKDV